MAAVFALAFAGLLLLAMAGMFLGIGRAFTATIDRSPADIIILNAKSESLMGDSNGMPRRIKPAIYMHPEVISVQELAGAGGQFRNIPGPNDKSKQSWVQIMGVDPYPGSATMPTDFSEATRIALLDPYAIAIDSSAQKGLGVKLGDLATINGKTVKVAVLLEGYPNMMQSLVVMSRDTMRLMRMGGGGNRIGPLMVKVADPARVTIVRDQLNAVGGDQYRAWLRPELAKANEDSMLKEQFIGIMLGFSVFLSVLIGVGITSQTLRGAILANIKELASLRALGVSMGALRLIVVELSFWVGIAGISAAFILTFAVSALANSRGVPMFYPPWLLISTSVLLLVIALLSGMLSLGMLKKSQPADLLR